MSGGVIELFSQLARNDFGFFQKITSLTDVMSGDVKMVTLDHTYEQVVELFRTNNFHHAPVVADDGDVVGMVSDRDLCRHRPPHVDTPAEADDDHLALQATAGQFMTRGLVSVSASSSFAVAVAKMLEYHIDSVLVYDESTRVTGIITTRDIIKTIVLFHRVCTKDQSLERLRLVDLDVARGLPLDMIFSRGARSVRDVMTRDVKCLAADDQIETAIDLMQTLQVRHLPVIDDAKRLLGWVTDRDILSALPTTSSRNEPVPDERFRARLFSRKGALTMPVTAIMDPTPTTLSPEGLFVEALEQLSRQTGSGLPVVENDQLVGVLTNVDMLRVLGVILQIGDLLATE